MAPFVVAKIGEISPGRTKLIQIGKRLISIFHTNGTYYALDEMCPHRAGPLSEGKVLGATVTCPWHGATFDLKTGKSLSVPTLRSAKCYEVRVVGEEIVVLVTTDA